MIMKYLALLTFSIFLGCAEQRMPGSSIPMDEAIKKSMVLPISETAEMKYKKPLVARCQALEEPVEPGQIIIDSCRLYQRFKIIEIISGIINREFRCDYTVILPRKEKRIKKGTQLILILRDDKADGIYHVAKAMTDNERNRRKIDKSIDAQSHLINWP
jgi:hypothetical protein